MTGISAAIVGSLVIAAISTLGDFIWAMWVPEHRMAYGLMHGALLFLGIGLFLGVISSRPAAGAVGGAAIGFAAAGVFYLLAPVMGFSAMFVAWVGLWMALAALYGRLTGGAMIEPRVVVSRGAIAAVASGLAFYSISGIWRPFNPEGWDYAEHFAAWTVAYVPGFAALLLARQRQSA